jgi:hypothetical protein
MHDDKDDEESANDSINHKVSNHIKSMQIRQCKGCYLIAPWAKSRVFDFRTLLFLMN